MKDYKMRECKMKSKKLHRVIIGAFILTMITLSVFAGFASAATISSVDIKITEPVTGAAVSKPTTTTNGVDLSASWSPYVSDTFNADTEYTVNITVTAKSGNTLSDSFSAKVNGHSATVDGKVVSYTFKKTEEAKTIDTILLTLETPKAANTPQKNPQIDSPNAGVKASIVWSPADSKFELGKKYTATITLETTNAKAYPFADAVTVKVNGYPKTPTKNSQTKLTVTHEFEETQPKGTAKSVALTITAPSIGKTPDKKIISNSQSDMVTASISWDTTGAFKPDTFYTATITLTAKDGYVIDKDMTATVNGESTYPICESNKKATISYTFGQIASVDTVDISFPAPKTGEVPVTAATGVVSKPVAAKSATIKWSPKMTGDQTFEAGTEYTAEVTIPLGNSDVVFDDDTIVRINGDMVTDAVKRSSDSKTLTVTYKFQKTTFIPTPMEVIKEFLNLTKMMLDPTIYGVNATDDKTVDKKQPDNKKPKK